MSATYDVAVAAVVTPCQYQISPAPLGVVHVDSIFCVCRYDILKSIQLFHCKVAALAFAQLGLPDNVLVALVCVAQERLIQLPLFVGVPAIVHPKSASTLNE